MLVYLWNVEMVQTTIKLLSVPEGPPMGHYGTLVVAGLSDHTVKLTPLTIFNCTEVVRFMVNPLHLEDSVLPPFS